MAYINKIILALICIILLYFYKYSFVKFFSIVCNIIPKELSVENTQIFGLLIINIMQLFVVLFCYYFYKSGFLSNDLKFVFFVILSTPVFFHISDIFYDKSCVKAWQHLNKLTWYLPLNLPIIYIIFIKLKKIYLDFSKIDYILICFIFLMYHFIKPY